MKRFALALLTLFLFSSASAQPVVSVPPDFWYYADAVCTSNVASRSGLAVSCGGFALNADGHRVLLTAQTNAGENGLHIVHPGPWQQIRLQSALKVAVAVLRSDALPGWWVLQQAGNVITWGTTPTTWALSDRPPLSTLPGAVQMTQLASGSILRAHSASIESSLVLGTGWLVAGAASALFSTDASITGPMNSAGQRLKGRCKVPAALLAGRNLVFQARKQTGSAWADVAGGSCQITGGGAAECSFDVASVSALGDQYGLKVTPNVMGVISTSLQCALEVSN